MTPAAKGRLQITDPVRRLPSPTASGARRLKIFVTNEAATLATACHLVAFSSSSTNENHVLFSLWVCRYGYRKIQMSQIKGNDGERGKPEQSHKYYPAGNTSISQAREIIFLSYRDVTCCYQCSNLSDTGCRNKGSLVPVVSTFE